jgi:hypothetical protein
MKKLRLIANGQVGDSLQPWNGNEPGLQSFGNILQSLGSGVKLTPGLLETFQKAPTPLTLTLGSEPHLFMRQEQGSMAFTIWAPMFGNGLQMPAVMNEELWVVRGGIRLIK